MMSDQDYKPIDYKINKNGELSEQATQYIKNIAMQQAKVIVAQETKKIVILVVALLILLLYMFYDFNQTVTTLENNFKKQVSEYQKRMDVLEADKKK